MTFSFLPNTGKGRNRVTSGIFRAFTLSLMIAVFALTFAHAQTVAYVVNFSGVSVINTSTNSVTATIPFPVGSPLGIVVSPDGTRAYLTTGSTISVIDTAANTTVAIITVLPPGLGNLALLAITPDGKNLYVPEPNGNVFVVSTVTNSVTATIPTPLRPTAVAITPDGTQAYALDPLNGEVLVINTATNSIVASINLPAQTNFDSQGRAIAIAPGGADVYALDGVSVAVIATSSNTVASTFSLNTDPNSTTPFAIAISPDGGTAYVAVAGLGLDVVDVSTNTVVATIPVGSFPSFPQAVAVTPDGAFVYVANGSDNTVSVIDTSSNTVVATVPVGDFSGDIAIANIIAPFAQFSITGLTVNKNGFTELGTFTLGANSSGLDLAHQPVTLTADGFSLTIAPGSFRQVGGNVHFVFNGTINGLPVSMNLMATGGTSTSFKYSATVSGVDLTGQPNPATVGLTIGENTGTATAPF